jgi:hypothetical protein
MSTIHMHQTTTSTPEQFLAALIDYGVDVRATSTPLHGGLTERLMWTPS